MSTIELERLSKRYGGMAAVDEVSLEVAEGELLTILGPSGSGKTTLLTMIAGLTEPSSGRILIGGQDVTGLPPAARNIGLVFQSYALFPHMSVAGNVAFPLEVRSMSRAEIGRRVEEALRMVRLEGLERRRPHEISGGQQQRVALARATVFTPAILLLDEPLAALDRKLREEVQVELRELQRRLGVTTVLVTHDQEEALSLSDRIVVLDRGVVQQLAAPEEAYARPANRFVAEFLGIANILEGTIERTEKGCRLRLPGGPAVPCPTPADARPDASLLVRPERLRLLPPDAAQGLPAEIIDQIFLGQATRTILRTATGQRLVAQSAEPPRGARPGQRVRCGWAAEEAWLLPPERAPAQAR
jgi:putative spermidine/putrescine transport system ATP-binding protein